MSEEQVPNQELFFRSYNESSPTTVILLHGLFSCNLEWEHVVPHLKEYHIIVPDLPKHSQSREIGPFSLSLAAYSVATLIKNHAHDGKAHVVGLSLGGFVTMEVVHRHPALVSSAFVTGSAPFSPWQVWAAKRPSLLHYSLSFVHYTGLYTFLVWKAGFKNHQQLSKEIIANNDWNLVNDAYSELAEWQQEAVQRVAAQDKRILVAGGDQGDNLEGTKELALELQRQGCEDGKKSCAYVVKGATHAWDLQFPELFADGIKAWIEGRPLPQGFESLL